MIFVHPTSAFFILTYLFDVLCQTTGGFSVDDGNSNENATIKNLIGRVMMTSMVIMMTSSEAAMMMNCR